MITNTEQEAALKENVRIVWLAGQKKDHFKKVVKKSIIKISTASREITKSMIDEAHGLIDKFWLELRAEAITAKKESKDNG